MMRIILLESIAMMARVMALIYWSCTDGTCTVSEYHSTTVSQYHSNAVSQHSTTVSRRTVSRPRITRRVQIVPPLLVPAAIWRNGMDGSTKLHKSRGTLEGIMSIITAHSRPLFVPFSVEAEEALKPVYIKHCICAQHPI